MTDDAAPSWTLSPSQVDLVTLLTDGALAPLEGPLTPDQLAQVRDHHRLPDGPAWRGEPVLVVDTTTSAAAERAGTLTLRDEDGTVLAQLTVAGAATLDRTSAIVGGVLRAVARRPVLAFAALHRTPEQAREQLREVEGPRTVVQPATVPDVGTLERWRHHLDVDGGSLLVQPAIGQLPDSDWAATVRAHRQALAHLPDRRCLLQLVALPRDADVRDAATLRAIVAANHGADRLLDAVGVDPAVAADRGLELLPRPVPPTGPWHPDVQAELDRIAAAGRGVAVLLTGLSGAGKSTIARALRARLLELGERRVTLLDGDLVRRTLSSGLGFSPEDRETNVRRIGWVAAEIARHGGVAICAPIAPEDRVRRAVRHDVEAAGGRFLLVHVATSLEVCERRDVKGLYSQARAGQLSGLTGVDAPYEEPADAELTIDTAEVTVEAAVQQLVEAIGAAD